MFTSVDTRWVIDKAAVMTTLSSPHRLNSLSQAHSGEAERVGSPWEYCCKEAERGASLPCVLRGTALRAHAAHPSVHPVSNFSPDALRDEKGGGGGIDVTGACLRSVLEDRKCLPDPTAYARCFEHKRAKCLNQHLKTVCAQVLGWWDKDKEENGESDGRLFNPCKLTDLLAQLKNGV